ncbi:MAG: DUF1624 domain-containing protein [Bacteriovoracaceae bacterium]|nr:DUF1624 domain-containing protein [Bacteriovoracaceae bacterium]
MNVGKNRYIFLDQLRGISIVLMVIFHFAYDLNYFNFVEIDFFKDKFWFYFPRLITFMFLTCVGISIAIVHRKKLKWRKAIKRFLILASWGLIISGLTYLAFPSRWIYFGILHCIALSSVAAIIFIKVPVIAGLVGLSAVILDIFFGIGLPWIDLPRPALDYIPFFPWFGAVLFGLFLHRIDFHTLKTDILPISPLAYLGKHSLLIYLIHQPLLFGLVGGAFYLKNNWPF